MGLINLVNIGVTASEIVKMTTVEEYQHVDLKDIMVILEKSTMLSYEYPSQYSYV